MAYSVHCRITGPRQDRYRIEFRFPEGERVRVQIASAEFQQIYNQIVSTHRPPDAELRNALHHFLFGHFKGLLEKLIARSHEDSEQSMEILLEIEDYRLERMPWELAELGMPRVPMPALEIIRFSTRTPRLAKQLPTLPFRVLIADMSPADETEPTFPIRSLLVRLMGHPGHLTQIIQPIEMAGLNRNDLRGLLSASHFDVVHLRGLTPWPNLYDAQTLVRLFERSGTRLLILNLRHSVRDYLAAFQLTDLGRGIIARGGPATLIVASDDPSNEANGFLEEIYASIFHDLPLDIAVNRARRRWRTRESGSSVAERSILMVGQGAENLLRISPLADNLIRRSDEQSTYASLLNHRIARLPDHPRLWSTHSPDGRVLHVRDLIKDAVSSAKNVKDRAHEFRELIPLADALRVSAYSDDKLLDASRQVERAEKLLARVLNSCFYEGARVVPDTETLRCGRPYTLRIQIGQPAPTSHVRKPRELPEGILEELYDESGIDLDVSAHSDDFTMPEGANFSLRLPRVGPSQPVQIAMWAPDTPSVARLRICVYYQQNLLQSLMVTAKVTSESMTVDKDGNFAEVEFSIADLLLGVEELPSRTFNILTNERADGTHTFVIHGPNFEQQYSFPDTPAIKVIRQRLLEVCSEIDGQGKPVAYRFSDPTNSGDKNKLVADLKALAPVGYTLYFDLIANPANKDLEAHLRSALNKPGAIQISVTSADKNVFPWALLYDKPFVGDPGNIVCPSMLQRIESKTGADLRSNSCVDGVCPFVADTNVICPLGFWGFRHAIEQLPPNTGEVVTTIKVQGSVAFVMAVHRELSGTAHRAEIEAEAAIRASYCDAKKLIGEELSGTKPHFIYFYCHGGRTASTPWLGVGNNDQIQTTDFHAWNAHWPQTHPLVLINGCHTVDLSPDDLLNFVTVFAWCNAAGVIGTEIAIPESLGREFGRQFVTRFFKGETVASIFAELRLSLLAKWNLLGLCYTPYCHGELHLVQG